MRIYTGYIAIRFIWVVNTQKPYDNISHIEAFVFLVWMLFGLVFWLTLEYENTL